MGGGKKLVYHPLEDDIDYSHIGIGWNRRGQEKNDEGDEELMYTCLLVC